MKEKYFVSTGEISFRLWMFANALDELKKFPNQEKAQNLRGKISAFVESPLVAKQGSNENKEDLATLLLEIEDLC